MLYSILIENMTALSPLIIALLIIITLLFSLPKFTRFLVRFTNDKTWIERYRTIRTPIIVSMLFFGLHELIYDLDLSLLVTSQQTPKTNPDSPLTYQIIASHICLLFGYMPLFQIIQDKTFSRWFNTIFFIAFGYQSLSIWGHVPFFDELIVHAQNEKYGSLFSIPIAAIITLLIHAILDWIVLPLVQKTDTDFDDRLYNYVKNPILISILLIGFTSACSQLDLSSFWQQGLISFFLSIAVFIWSRAFFGISALILQALESNQEKFKFVQPRTLPIYSIVSRIVLTVISVYAFLLVWQLEGIINAWLASAGIIGIAVAYASQDTLSSLLAGVAILTDAPYKLNDFLILENGHRGQVTHIGFRSTRILTPEHLEIVIPNSIMSTTQITNMSGGKRRYARIDCAAGVAYGTDIDQVREILLNIASEIDHLTEETPETKPKVHFVSMGASSLDFVLRIWIDDPIHLLDVQDQANTLIYTRFTEANIEIPYSKQDVYLYDMSAQKSS